MRKILVVQHVVLEGGGLLLETLQERGWTLDLRIMELPGTELPRSLKGYHALLVLGGPMGAYEEERYPYLFAVEDLIREGIEESMPVLGICLGGQLIARAFQAEVRPNRVKEIGWYPLFLTSAGKESSLFAGLPDSFPVFQWHGDAFELPEGALLLATGESCRNQAFLYRGCALALQFHPEVTREMVRSWALAYTQELVDFGGPEAPRKLEGDTERVWQDTEKLQERLIKNLSRFLEGDV